ncbi:MAG: MATE family efflux transporter [Oscillospiraceae bacterium]|nr:MATE family efflux transporter [Oscillospiraceae bacterium]
MNGKSNGKLGGVAPRTRLEILETAPVAQSILRLALPTMLGMAVQMLYNLTDTFFIGKTNNPLLVAGISIVSPIFFIIQGIGNMFAIGSASLISRQLGAKENESARRTSSVAFYSTLALGALITLLLLAFRSPLLQRIGTSADTLAPANDYLTVIAWFSLPMVINIAFAGQMRSEGATMQATISMAIGIIVNIFLDPLFILAMNMGAAGAAWATVIGHLCSLVYNLYYFTSGRSMLSIRPRDCKPSLLIYSETLKIGAPAALSQVVMSASMVLSNVVASGFGDALVAGIGVYMRVGGLCLSLLMGLTMGYQPFAGYQYGARTFKRLLSGLKVTTLYATVLSCLFALMFYIWGEQLIRVFIQDPDTVEAGSMLLRALVFAMPFVGLQLTLGTTFQALGQSVNAMIITLGRQCFFYIPLLYTLPRWFGVTGFAFAQPVADILTTLIAVLLGARLLGHIRAIMAEDERQRASV